MARRGRDQITVRLEDDVLEELRPLIGSEGGRAGGLSFYLRRLIYQDLGRPLPKQYGRESEAVWYPQLVTRLQHWLQADPDERDEILEAARLLARQLELDLVEPEELARLRGEAERLRRLLAKRPAPPAAPQLGSEFRDGRYAGLKQGAELAEELIQIHREGRTEKAKGICKGLRIAADFCRTVMDEIRETPDRQVNGSVSARARTTRDADPSFLRSVAVQWQLVLRQNPDDQRAREALGELEAKARAAGIEIPPLPPGRSRHRPSP